jgi:hypothetical protein
LSSSAAFCTFSTSSVATVLTPRKARGGNRAHAGKAGNFIKGGTAGGASVFIVFGEVIGRLAKQKSRH